MIVEDRQWERGRTKVKEAGKGRETDEQMKRKGRGRKGDEREERAHWCWHLRERWRFNALVEGTVSSGIWGLYLLRYTQTHTHTQTHTAKRLVEESRSASPCVDAHSPVVYSSPLASVWCVCVCVCVSPSISINSSKSTYLCMLKIFLTDWRFCNSWSKGPNVITK